jgi:hypothetical protein
MCGMLTASTHSIKFQEFVMYGEVSRCDTLQPGGMLRYHLGGEYRCVQV